MTRVTIYQTKSKEYKRVTCIGHAGFAEYGRDVVCAAISCLTINTINSLDELLHEQVNVVTNEKEGLIDFSFPNPLSKGGILLMDSYVLGLKGIVNDYDGTYLELKFKEV